MMDRIVVRVCVDGEREVSASDKPGDQADEPDT